MRSSETSGRSSHERSRRPAIDGHRAIDLVEQRAVAAAVHRFDDFEVLQRDRIDQQAVGRRLVGDAADVREIGFLRVAQIVEQGAGGATPRTRVRRGRTLRARSCGTDRCSVRRADSCSNVHGSTRVTGSRSPAPSSSTRLRSRSTAATISRGRSTITSSASACSPAGPGIFGARKLAGRQIEQRDARRRYGRIRIWHSGFGTASATAETPARARRGAANRSACPGDTTRTISRLTMPLAFFGSST